MNDLSIFRQYREAKAEADKWKKISDSLGKEIKERLVDTPLVENEGYNFERKVSVRSKLDEDGLVDYLQREGYTNALTTKVVLNEQAVSELIVSGAIDVSVIDNYTTNTEVVSLYCKKAKEVK